MKENEIVVEKKLERLPNNLVCLGYVISNFNHKVGEGAERLLKEHRFFGYYPAKNFFGYVWYTEGKFRCQIDQYHKHINTIEEESLEKIMKKASDLYGAD